MYEGLIKELSGAIARMEYSDDGWACVDIMKEALEAIKTMDKALEEAEREAFLNN